MYLPTKHPLTTSEDVIRPKQSSSPKQQLPKIGRQRDDVTATGTCKSPTHARRRHQNREAQRAFRARQRQHIEEIARENKELVERNRELEERCEKLQGLLRLTVKGEMIFGEGAGWGLPLGKGCLECGSQKGK
jgi:Mg2+ and Co2+ transporter CorA